MPTRSTQPRHRRRAGASAALLAAVLAVGGAGLTAPAAVADTDPSPVRVNQIGYLTGADKVATVVTAGTTPRTWQLLTPSGTVAASGTTTVHGSDRASGDHLHHADFSSVTTAGTYTLSVDGVGRSVPFTISGSALYPDLGREALQYFYFHRMGTAVEGQYLQNPAHAHAALHPGDSSIPCYNNWCGSQRLNVKDSWADAGDFGIYPVNHAISAWTLLNLYERYPDAYPDGSLRIPENGNNRPDILDEVEFGSRFMSGMLPSTGLASHKVHNHVWSAFPLTSVDQENGLARSAMPPSTNATYAVARTNAQLARTLAPYDATRAAQLWASAEDAWTRAEAQPNVDYPNGTDAEGGGDYGDTGNSDDRYAAAAELYLTGLDRADSTTSSYRSAVTTSPHYREVGHFDWLEVAATGTLSLLSVDNDLPAADIAAMEANLRAEADAIASTIDAEGYPVPLPGDEPYPWGSNSSVVNRMLVLGVAYDTSDDDTYLRAMNRAMDYLMGNNAMRLSYVTGYGEYYETDTHDRWAWGKYPGTPYPRGWLSGGPNSDGGGDSATPLGRPAAKSYAPMNTAPDAWGSKENTINWNAPLAWTATFLNRTAPDLGGGNPNPGDTQPPTAPTLAATGVTATSVTLSWSGATDNVGVTGYDVYRDGVRVNSTPVVGTTFTDSGLSASTAYSYTVRARDAAGNVSSASPALRVTTEAGGGNPGPTGNVKVQYRNADSSATDNAIRPHLRIANTGTSALNLSTVTARYYFTRDGASSVNVFCDWAQIGCSNIRTNVVNLSTPVNGADAYVEISFTSGSVAAGQNTGDIQLRINKSDWSAFNEANDYSYGTGTSFADAPKIPAYTSGTLAWGTPAA
ncbi:glycoside hydrolase family 9 protein [Allostreptomyces psammosilenae]|uniref:Endoglucanase n=1 Tax=Allostreptomyces psammosilenae TaxID=1892865 RepID=A0A852ZMM3_9ACTN|nr:glycoside hydrolase family 9 protein [Allostreptomyces psammosilenae]NYI03676.1 endoglucanase [Allostreptomyces psammosilenae]